MAWWMNTELFAS